MGVSVGVTDRVFVEEGDRLRVGVLEVEGVAVSVSLAEGDDESEEELLLVQLEEGVPVREAVAVDEREDVGAAVPVCELLSVAVSEGDAVFDRVGEPLQLFEGEGVLLCDELRV